MVCLPPFVRHLAKYAKVWKFLPLRWYAMEHGIYSRHAVSVTRSSTRRPGGGRVVLPITQPAR